MILFYIDESGNSGANLSTPDQPVAWLVALAATEQAVQQIEAKAGDIAEECFPKDIHKPDFEFKGSAIFHGSDFCKGMPPDKRVELYDRLLALLPAHGVRLFARGIHKARHSKRATQAGYYEPSHPYALGFMFLAETLDEWLHAKQPKEAGSGPLLGLAIADEQEEVARRIVASFGSWRRFGTDFGYRARVIQHLIDTVHYVPSHDSRMLQLADCAAYVINRLWRIEDVSGWNPAAYNKSEAAVHRLWDNYCRPCLEHHRVWPGFV